MRIKMQLKKSLYKVSMYLTQSTLWGTLSRSNWNLGQGKTGVLNWNLKLTLHAVKVSGMRRIRDEKFISGTCGRGFRCNLQIVGETLGIL